MLSLRYEQRKLRELEPGNGWYEREPGHAKSRQAPRVVLRLNEYVREFPHEPAPAGVPCAIILARLPNTRIPLDADPDMSVWAQL